MALVELAHPADAIGWRKAARDLLLEGVPPESVTWTVSDGARVADTASGAATEAAPGPASGTACGVGADVRQAAGHAAAVGCGSSGSVGTDLGGDLFGALPALERVPVATPRVPRPFVELAERVACHRSPQRFGLLYRVLWRLQHEQPRLLDNAADADVHLLHRWGKAVSRDRHKMHAFVRFRETPGAREPHFTAWFEPDHRIERLAAGFFCRRFTSMRFSIFTPHESVHWDTETLRFGPGGSREVVGGEDGMEALWREYFANIFNPARLKLDAMRAEMPVKYWKNLPEAPLIASLTRDAGRRTAAMVAAEPTVAPRFAQAAGLPDAAAALQSRRAAADDSR